MDSVVVFAHTKLVFVILQKENCPTYGFVQCRLKSIARIVVQLTLSKACFSDHV